MDLELFTDRLRLTPLSWRDLDLALGMFTDPEVVKYVCDLLNEETTRTEMSNWVKRGGNGCIGIWCVSDRQSGEKLGSSFLLPMPVEEDDTDYNLVVPGEMPEGEIEIGFCFRRSAWGKGYATEASIRLLKFAFEETPLNEIVASFYEEDVASKNVLRKAGFIDRGRMWCYGEDSPNYRITRQEWLRLHDFG